jgi:transcriptional regulator with XRE-family HTH domain
MTAKRVRLARARKAAGFTQERLAEAMHLDRSTVARWESGQSEPLPYLRPKLAKTLGITLAQLEALLAPPETNPESPAIAPQAVDHKGAPTSLPALNAEEIGHVRKALRDAHRYFDESVVGYFHRQLHACMADDGELGPIRTLPTVLGLLGAVEQHGRALRPPTRQQLLAFGARCAEFAGWLYRDSNDPIRAAGWYDRAMEWAQEAADLPMQGYMLLKKSQMAYDAQDALRVHTLAQAAFEGPWQLPTRVRAEVTQQAALGLAMIGEPLFEIERVLDDARRMLGQAEGIGAETDQLGAFYNESTLVLRNASTFTEAGKPSVAAAIFDDVLRDAPLSRRDGGYFRSRRASALALSGEPDEAAAVGLAAVDIASVTDSHRTMRVLGTVVRTLSPWKARASVRELVDAVASRSGH